MTAGLPREHAIQRGYVCVEILDGVIEDLTLLQENVNLNASSKAEELSRLLHGQSAFAIGSCNGLFQQRASRVASGRNEILDKLVRDFDCDSHRQRVAGPGRKRDSSGAIFKCANYPG
jgi:hypothetical protein